MPDVTATPAEIKLCNALTATTTEIKLCNTLTATTVTTGAAAAAATLLECSLDAVVINWFVFSLPNTLSAYCTAD